MRTMTDDALLRIYLNDHLAGAAGGVALAGRLVHSYRGTTEQAALERLAGDVVADRDSLLAIVGSLGLPRTYYKEAVALAGERLGRLKLNGSIVKRSLLSFVVELEMMTLGVTGKRSGWRSLRELSESDARLNSAQLDELIRRADDQLEVLEELRIRAVKAALMRA